MNNYPKFLITCYMVFLLLFLATNVYAQGADRSFVSFSNISNTTTSSTYPCIIADIDGNVHVFWSEDVDGPVRNLITNPDGSPAVDLQGDQINLLTRMGNTLFYSEWNRGSWQSPVDVKVSPTGLVLFPRAAIDSNNTIYVTWVQTLGGRAQLFISQVSADQADNARKWSSSDLLADQMFSSLFPMDIAIDSLDRIHIIFSKLGAESGVFAINSSDGGETWSTPYRLFQVFDPNGAEEGASTLKLNVDKKDKLHATWTLYDKNGNGKAIFYSQSSNSGESWSEPYEVAAWQSGWYETDWLSVGVIDDEIHLVWEGGQVASLNERISHDGGKNWDESRQILPNLVGENGFANLVLDTADKLHMLVVKRGDGYTLTNGIWFSTWNGSEWNEPLLLATRDITLYATAKNLSAEALSKALVNTFTGNGIRYQDAAILNGNQLFTVVVNEWGGEIWGTSIQLDAPPIEKTTVRKTPTLVSTTPPLPDISTIEQIPAVTTPTISINKTTAVKTYNQNYAITIAILPTFLVIIGLLAFTQFRRK